MARQLRRPSDALAGGGVLLAAIVFAYRACVYGSTFFGRAALAYVSYAMMACAAVSFMSWAQRAKPSSRLTAARLLMYPIGVFFGGAAIIRLLIDPVQPPPPPLVVRGIHAPLFDVMTPDERATWALRMVAFSLTGVRVDTTLSVPETWPYPKDAAVALITHPDRSRLLYARSGHQRVCYERIAFEFDSPWERPDPQCRAITAAERDLGFRSPRRSNWKTSTGAVANADLAWPQYRRDAARIGSTNSVGEGFAWNRRLLDGARASASIVGDRIIVGTHGSGSLEAFDVRTGEAQWRLMLPNWVHQDAVSDGRVAVVGFGDNMASLHGRAPAGVAAIDLANGRVLWVHFEMSSVMTSPVVWGDRTVYVNAAGGLRARDLKDGTLRGRIELPGFVLMAPPVLVGSALIVTLDRNRVCSVNIAGFHPTWCVTLDDMDYVGHSSAGVFGDTVILSGQTRPSLANWHDNFVGLSWKMRLSWAWSLLTLRGRENFDGQRIVALRLGNGRMLWKTPPYLRRQIVEGHISGTPTADDTTVVVNLPIPSVLVGLSRGNGRVSWVTESGGSRGPVLLVNRRVYTSTRNGEIRVLDASSGQLTCSVSVERKYDRIGPVLTQGSMYFASADGYLTAIPQRWLDSCQVDSVQALFSAPLPGKRNYEHRF